MYERSTCGQKSIPEGNVECTPTDPRPSPIPTYGTQPALLVPRVFCQRTEFNFPRPPLPLQASTCRDDDALLSHLVTIAVLPDSASPKNMNFTILPRPLVVGLFSANFCAREFILFSTTRSDPSHEARKAGGGSQANQKAIEKS